MPESSNVTELQRMESDDGRVSCCGLTPIRAVLYGCIPSLISSQYAGQQGGKLFERQSPAIVAMFVAAAAMPKYLNGLQMISS